jgi:Tfp pilus assembly protein PilW
MVCKNTSIKAHKAAAFTLTEVMISSALALIALTALLMFSFFSSRSFAAISNYVLLNQHSEIALDKMSREIRQAHRLTAFSTNAFTLLDANSNTVRYVYDSPSRSLLRISGGVTKAYLANCDSLTFYMYQHTPMSNSFDCYQPAYVTNARLIQVKWVCSSKILGVKANSENMESAKIAIRNK